jgi:hypothetical protein
LLKLRSRDHAHEPRIPPRARRGARATRCLRPAAAERRYEGGLHVWIQPRLYNGSQAEVLAHLGRTARAAERLRRKYSRVSLNVGVESIIFTPGMVPGRTWSKQYGAAR